MDLSNVLE